MHGRGLSPSQLSFGRDRTKRAVLEGDTYTFHSICSANCHNGMLNKS